MAILKGAARVFARQGVAGASMAQVAAEAGVSKGTLYHYWDGKDALLFEVLDGYLSALRDVIVAEDALLPMLTATLLAYDGMDDEHRIQSEGLILLDPARAETLKRHQREMVTALSRVLAAEAPGLTGRALREATMSVFGMLNWFYMWNPGADRAARVAYAGTVATIATGGIGALR
ncbi:TetR/AcrR family transcriptional regulator [Jannaschia sp. S6380]|uniref:TetR/AcrR family transcriptional regulator n=1 Tax=Jannaschia sp. S6380 TaxID=2926408 RepID=UPI001FF68588|nr:TetR/AcrR family transcriptional regulator [Jannaschia sp. S6380]MCK0168370.1 TetR/AcrR family transcriptional regulator [Jannaschia sp. S6380]